jgi:hypothetical protein
MRDGHPAAICVLKRRDEDQIASMAYGRRMVRARVSSLASVYIVIAGDLLAGMRTARRSDQEAHPTEGPP